MRKEEIRYSQLLLLICICGVTVSQSICDSQLNQNDCQNQSSCAWSNTQTFQCENKVDCSEEVSELSCNSVDNNQCEWKASDKQNCSIKPNACALNNDTQQCNYPTSCILNKAKDATCAPKAPFGCVGLQQNDCQGNNLCSWESYSCQSYCDTMTYNTCKQNINNCTPKITACSPSPNAQKTCQLQKTPDTCKAQGCVYSTVSIPACQPPTTCTLQEDQTCLNACQISTYTCTPIQQGKCIFPNQEVCTQNAQCSWDKVPSCQDNPDYCNMDTCISQQTLCSYNPSQQANCVNNDQNNQCQKQALQTDCLQLGYCNFKQQTDQCLNVQNCSFFNDGLCQQYDNCSYNEVFKCIATQPSNSNSATSLTFASLLLLLITLV